MKAGRELDALVAEKVMGLINGPIIEIVGGKAVNAEGHSVLLPNYSTDIATAWEVVERLAAENKHLELSAPGSYSDEGLGPAEAWSAVFCWPDDTWHECEGVFDCETACLAICLAALEVKGIDSET